jgi:hypothetical protein
MTTITIQFDDTSKLQKILNMVKRLKLPFQISEPETPVSEEDLIIKERLRKKYVASGQWDTMSLDEKEDAALLESMLYDQDNGIELLSPSEQKDFLNELSSLSKS